MRTLTALLIASSFALAASGAESAFPAAVVVAPDADPVESTAAAELARYISEASGADVPVTTEARSPAVYVGEAAQVDLPADLPGDGFVIERAGADVHIRGGSPRGTLYGAWRYLEEAIGWRWLQPGEGGEVLTADGDPLFPRERLVDAPAFEIRGLVRPWIGVIRWYQRLGMNWGLSKLGWDLRATEATVAERGLSIELGEHNFHFFAPEGATLCPNDPATIEHATATMDSVIGEHPWVAAFGLWPEDGYYPFCACDECGPLDPRERLDGRYLRVFNPVARAMHERRPGVPIGLLAYNNYLHPPDDPRPFTENTQLAFAAPILHADLLGSDAPGDYVDALAAWQERGVRRIWVYEYYYTGHEAKRLNLLFPSAIARELRMLDRMGVSGLMPQIANPPERNWGVGLNYYVTARLLWDPDANVADLVRRYCDGAWGEAGPIMAEFVDRWERAGTLLFRLSLRPEETPPDAAGTAARLIDECAALLERAESAGMPPAGRRWLELWQATMRAAEVMTEALVHWAEAHRALDAGDGARARTEALACARAMAGMQEAVGEVEGAELLAFLGDSPLADDARTMARAITEVGVQFRAPRTKLRLLPHRRNADRGGDELVLYTPEHGATTGTNQWGVEVVVRDGVVSEIQLRQGGAAIPEDGFVLSGHGAAGHRMFDLRVGDRIIVEPLRGR